MITIREPYGGFGTGNLVVFFTPPILGGFLACVSWPVAAAVTVPIKGIPSGFILAFFIAGIAYLTSFFALAVINFHLLGSKRIISFKESASRVINVATMVFFFCFLAIGLLPVLLVLPPVVAAFSLVH